MVFYPDKLILKLLLAKKNVFFFGLFCVAE